MFNNYIAYQFTQSQNHLHKTMSIQVHPFSCKNLVHFGENILSVSKNSNVMCYFSKRLIGWFGWVLKSDWMFHEGDFSTNRTPQSAICVEIALLRANQIAGNTNDFKMNIIKWQICTLLHYFNQISNSRKFYSSNGVNFSVMKYLKQHLNTL